MDPKRNFTDDDMAKAVKFLNMVAEHARFDMDTSELIEYFKHLQFMQKVLLPKMNDHVLEVKRVIEAQEAEEAEEESAPAEGNE